jgi:hypothetical protein
MGSTITKPSPYNLIYNRVEMAEKKSTTANENSSWNNIPGGVFC